MSLGKHIFLSFAAGMGALAIIPAPAAAGTVVAATGPSAGTYPVGTRIADTQRVTLRSGDKLTVLDSGGTRVLSGPGTFVLARQGAQARNSRLQALTTQRSATRARTGAVRPVYAEDISNPSLWYVDVAASGKICLADANAINLWRADTSAAQTYTVTALTAPGDGVQVSFAEKEMLGQWGAALQLREGETYTITAPAGASAAEVRFSFIGAVPDDVEDLAVKLIENGCMVQLGQLANENNAG